MRREILILLVTIALPFFALGQQTIQDSIMHDGLQREYILYVPDSYKPDNSSPLVLNYHGYTASALIQMVYGDFRSIADSAGFLVVHPMGTKDNTGNTHWNVGWGTSTVDDVGFTAALIDSLSAEWNINNDRVYSTGMSNGGFMSYKLACELSDRIAAIASVTGTMVKGQPGNCFPQHPMPVMEVHGTADNVVPYEGADWIESVENVLDYWADFNNCNEDPVITLVPDININDNSTVEHHLYSGGNNGVEVEHFKVIGGGHTWPGTILGGSTTNYDIDASEEIWKFFSKYDINGIIATAIDDEAAESIPKVNIYPNPTKSFVVIEFAGSGPHEITLMNSVAKVISYHSFNSKQYNLDLSALPNGFYFLQIGNRHHKIFKTE